MSSFSNKLHDHCFLFNSLFVCEFLFGLDFSDAFSGSSKQLHKQHNFNHSSDDKESRFCNIQPKLLVEKRFLSYIRLSYSTLLHSERPKLYGTLLNCHLALVLFGDILGKTVWGGICSVQIIFRNSTMNNMA